MANKTKQFFHLAMPLDIHKQLTKLAKQQDRSMTKVVVAMLREALNGGKR